MGGDVLFKTMTFGGFNKQEVLAYISEQQRQLVQAQNRLAENENITARINSDTAALDSELEQQKQRADEYFALSEEYAKKIFALEDEVNTLKAKLSSVEEGCERAKNVENQIGALVLDALLYSDKIIRGAKTAAKGISSQTKQTIEAAAGDVNGIGEDISQISDDFGAIVTTLVSKINSLSTNLSSVADKLDNEEIRIDEEQFTFGENGEVHLPALEDGDFGILPSDSEQVTQEDIRNLVDMLSAGQDYPADSDDFYKIRDKYLSSDPDCSAEPMDAEPETEVSFDDNDADNDDTDADEIDELTKRFLNGAL